MHPRYPTHYQMSYGQILVMTIGVVAFFCLPAACQEKGTAMTPAPSPESTADPFAGIAPAPAPAAPPVNQSFVDRFFSDNFGFRKELMAEFGVNDEGALASRLSIGFELLKKFSTKTRTFASVNFQGRLVRRDGFVGTLNDLEGMSRQGWYLEYHNAYAEFYNILDPLFSQKNQNTHIGRFNARIGHFYVPFGLNLQTDTHATILQLSNERNFGFERDWGVGFWGKLTADLRYDIYYLLGSGYAPQFNGQGGLGALRISLANKYASEDGLEGGFSFLGGTRLSPDAAQRSPAVMAQAGEANRVVTVRIGLDARLRRAVPTGVLTWTSELSGGKDLPDTVFTQLHQLDYLHASRRVGVSAQFRWFLQDIPRASQSSSPIPPGAIDSSLLVEVTWYFSNDVAGSNLHWIKLNNELQFVRQTGGQNDIGTLQYYRYW